MSMAAAISARCARPPAWPRKFVPPHRCSKTRSDRASPIPSRRKEPRSVRECRCTTTGAFNSSPSACARYLERARQTNRCSPIPSSWPNSRLIHMPMKSVGVAGLGLLDPAPSAILLTAFTSPMNAGTGQIVTEMGHVGKATNEALDLGDHQRHIAVNHFFAGGGVAGSDESDTARRSSRRPAARSLVAR